MARRERKTFFGQSSYNRDNLRVPDLEGETYKFSIFIPIQEAKKWEIFSYKEIDQLAKLLDRDFGGSTNTPIKEETQHPLIVGRYMMGNEIIHNAHVRFEVYTQQHPDVIQYFKELKANLETYSREIIAKRVRANGHETYKGEEKILIECSMSTIL